MMKKFLLFFIFISVIISCSTTKNGIKTNNKNNTRSAIEKLGTSYENSIFLAQTSEQAGVNAENAWLKKNYRHFKLKSQTLKFYENKTYDVMIIETSDGREKIIYFDISNFYGKY